MKHKKLSEVVDMFVIEYEHLWTDGQSIGLYGAGIGLMDKEPTIVVKGMSQEVLDRVPDVYEGYAVKKELGRIPRAL